jgi:TPR repeat protein
MRPNPAEAVSWLQKAVDLAQLEVAQDEQLAKQNKPLDTIEKAKHKAQFALGVYELGMSYSKGWGVKQDRVLALRCFEVAGSWGDADALAEAGFCYAEGLGTKKDMKKAARFYRQAEAKGMSMAGNSWYVPCKQAAT